MDVKFALSSHDPLVLYVHVVATGGQHLNAKGPLAVVGRETNLSALLLVVSWIYNT